MNLNDVVSAIGSSGALQQAAGEAGVDPSQAQDVLGGILSHVADGGSMEGMADAVAAKVGVDPSLVNQFLPMVLPLLQGHADANGEPSGGLGSLLGMASGLFGAKT